MTLRTVAAVEKAECAQGHPVHITVHLPEIPFQQCVHESIISRGIVPEPPSYHLFKHGTNLPVGQGQIIFLPAALRIKEW